MPLHPGFGSFFFLLLRSVLLMAHIFIEPELFAEEQRATRKFLTLDPKETTS